MNKDQFSREVAKRFELSVTKAKEVVEALFGTGDGEGIIAVELNAGRKVTLQGFGTFRMATAAARTSNVFGRLIEVPQRKKIRFKASKVLQNRIAATTPPSAE